MPKRSRSSSSSSSASASSSNNAGGEYMELNIGGYMYATTKAMLTSAPDGKLKALASVKRPLVDSEANMFIDRDGVAFEAVMAFLRTGVAIVPRESTRERVQKELDFYFDEPPTAVTEAQLALMTTGGATAFQEAATTLITTRLLRKLRKSPVEARVLRHSRYDITWTLVIHTRDFESDDDEAPQPLDAVVLLAQVPLPAASPNENVNVNGETIKCFFASLHDAPATMRDAEHLLALEMGASRVAISTRPATQATFVRVVFGKSTELVNKVASVRADAFTDAKKSAAPPKPHQPYRVGNDNDDDGGNDNANDAFLPFAPPPSPSST